MNGTGKNSLQRVKRLKTSNFSMIRKSGKNCFPTILKRGQALGQKKKALRFSSKGLLGRPKQSIIELPGLGFTGLERVPGGEVMQFSTFLDANGDLVEITHFPPSLKVWPFKDNGVFLLNGKVIEKFYFPSMEAEKTANLTCRKGPRY
jgi:hypothetical protein